MYTVDRGGAYGQYEYQEVVFGGANENLRIRHQMKASPFTEIYYIVVKKDKAADVYIGDLSLWDQQHIALKSSVANLNATLLLFTRS